MISYMTKVIWNTTQSLIKHNYYILFFSVYIMSEEVFYKPVNKPRVNHSKKELRSSFENDEVQKTDFMKLSGNLLSNINYKMVFIIFFIGMLIFSDIFIENVISRFSDAVYHESVTSKGTMIQLLFLCLAYIIFDLLNKYDVI